MQIRKAKLAFKSLISHRSVRHVLYHYMNWPFWLVYPIKDAQHKRYCRQYRVGMVIQDCNYHPCIITKVYEDDGTCDLVSLLDGVKRSCDLYHCVDFIKPEKAIKMINFYRIYGSAGLYLALGGSNRAWVHFETEWRLDQG